MRIDVVAIIVLFAMLSGMMLGKRLAEGEYEKKLADMYADSLVKIEQEAERRATVARQHANAEAAANEVRMHGQIDALRDARDECRWSLERIQSLNAAVGAANSRGKR